jgi:AraC-like DNA-binding protein
MNTITNLNALSVFIFIGVCQGFILSFFFIIKSSSNIKANLYQGLLLLSLALLMLEQFLNLTGYIIKVLPITNYSEPLNFTLGPLLYLFVKRSTDQSGSKKDWIHFIVFFLYLGYMCLDFIQSNDFKYNSYVNSYHPDWPLLKAQAIVPNDPLGIKNWVNLTTAVQLIIYISLAVRHLVKTLSQSGGSIFRTDDEILKPLRNMIFHFMIVIAIFIIVKICFKGDTGDYFIGFYVSIIFLITTFRVMNDSTYFDRSTSFMDISIGKYRKSSLTESGKLKILNDIILELKTRHYFSDNLASLSELAKKIGESPHHVSQVINEKLNKSFFELLASYRVEEAKRILSDNKNDNLTIEEISEMVGYNSKTAFNNAFKKLTGKTPSEFRKSINP